MKAKYAGIPLAFAALLVALWLSAPVGHAAINPDVPEYAPDFTLPTPAGDSLSLSQFKGKWVVLDFWGTWCKICLRGMPALKQAQEKYPGRFEIIGLDFGDKTVKWKQYVDSLDMPWHHVIISRRFEVIREYRVKSYPTKIIIDPEGRIVKCITGDDPRFFMQLDKLFGEK